MQRNACSIVLACLILAGCAKGGATRPHTDESSGRVADGAGPLQRISFWEPQLLYLLNSPHPRLHVEVDAVEGCQPSDATLNKLRDFLAAHCHKPGAVHVARGNVIPARDARGRSPGTLARQHADGPPRGADDPPPAFMHVLFYDGALCDQSPAGAATAPAARPKPPRPKHARGQPHVRLLPYPAIIFINTRYDASSARDEVLLHEAGHLLGLARRPSGASDFHCLDRGCLMNAAVRVSMIRRFLGLRSVAQDRLCRSCEAELAESSRRAPPTNLRFLGPVLVRSENGYHVLTLSDRIALVVGDLRERDCRDFAAHVRAEAPASDDAHWRAITWVKEDVRRDPAKLRDVIARARTDPYQPVRLAAERLEEAANGKNVAPDGTP